MKILAPAVLAVLALVALAGAFHGAEPAPARIARSPAAPPPACDAPPPGLLARVDTPQYRRTAALSLKVADCVKAEDELEAKLEKIRGEILDLSMEGLEGSRSCDLRLLVPAPAFRAFIGELRAMGKVRSEKIAAARIRPTSAAAAAEEVDPRELCLVSLRLADEKVALDVLQGQGVLAASLDRSASHLMKGVAVIAEGLGYVLPFALLAALPLGAALLLRRWRR